MVFLDCNYFSSVLRRDVSVYVLLPQTSGKGFPKGKCYRTLYLLHGFSDDRSAWMRRTAIERYAERYSIAVVMPDASHSFYTDMRYGSAYFTYVSGELQNDMERWFPLSDKRDDRFVAGNSMGGYGAFKLALSFPERYAKAASLSGALDITSERAKEILQNEYAAVYGETARASQSENNLLRLIERFPLKYLKKTMLYQICGKEDALYESNQTFRAAATKAKLSLAYFEEQGGHTWEFWDRHIQTVLEWL